MASSVEYLSFIAEQLSSLDGVSFRKMMGEYILYYKGKIAGGIYDDRLLIKPVKSALEYVGGPVFELPYEKGSPMLFIDNVDDVGYLCGLLDAIYDDLPEPKPKKHK